MGRPRDSSVVSCRQAWLTSSRKKTFLKSNGSRHFSGDAEAGSVRPSLCANDMPGRLQRFDAVADDLKHGEKRHGEKRARNAPNGMPEEQRDDHQPRSPAPVFVAVT